MDRAEAAGLGVATLGHVALLVALSVGFAATRLPVPKSDPIEVSFVEDVGLESAAPAPSAAEPAPLLAPEEGPPAPAMPAPPEVQPVPQPQPQPSVRAPAPAPTPAPAPKPTPRVAVAKPAPAPARPAPRAAQPKAAPAKTAPAKAAPAKAAPAAKPAAARPTGRLAGLLTGVSDRNTESRSTAAPAASAGPAVQASLAAEIRRQIKPHWKSPTGADVEQLRTEVLISLAPDGKVTNIRIVGTTGQTASNRPQVPLHREHAERAVRLASPFRLPAQYYDAWKSLRFNFDKRLSQ